MNILKRLSFRKRIIYSQCILFLVFIALLFPLISRTVNRLVKDSFEESITDLIDLIDNAHSESEMIELLRHQEFYVFFRITLFNDQKEVLYDSLLSRLSPGETSLIEEEKPEVEIALREGSSYRIGKSTLFAGQFAFLAKKFIFLNQAYALRTSFPFGQIQDITQNFEVGFLIFSFSMLLFFNALIWLIFTRLSRPIRSIIQAITPYQTGVQQELPEIPLKGMDADGDFERLAKTINSLSHRVRLQIQSILEERNEKEAILESLGEGVVAVDRAMEVRYVNFIASRMLYISRRQFLNKPFPDGPFSNGPFPGRDTKAPEQLIKKCHALLKQCQEKETIVTDSLSFGDEKRIYFDLIAAPIAKDKGAILVIQDKSSHYKVLEVGKDFVNNASHELRTPITIIKGFTETLRDLPNLSQEMVQDITEKILRSCERMENLVKNLLTLSDLENIPESRFKESDLVSLIDNCLHMLKMVHPEVLIDFKKTVDQLIVEADRDILEIAITNLLENAVKYSRRPAEILIQLEEMEMEARIAIQDRGIGIPKEDVEHIFDRFYTVDKARSRRLGGAGLGLSIVKTIVDKHEGEISVSSEIGKGTTFWIALPKKRQGSKTQLD